MKAVYSNLCYGDNPLISSSGWYNIEFYLISWVLSVLQTKKYYNEIELITDTPSIKLLEKLNLPFTSVKLELDKIKHYPKEFWALGKIKAYQLQQEEFIHIDSDVILFKPLPEFDSVLFQNKEIGDWFENYYRNQYTNLTENGVVPKSWGNCHYAVNCGIYGCKDLEYNKEYTKQSFELVDNNKDLIMQTGVPNYYSVVFEQYLAATVAEQLKTKINYLVDPFDVNAFSELGYVHIWGAKKEQNWYKIIRDILIKQYPSYYDNILKIIKDEYI